MERQLPVLATIIAIPGIFSDHGAYMVRMILPWFVFLFLISAAGLLLTSGEDSEGAGIVELISELVAMVAVIAIAVPWHRHLLRGEIVGGVQFWLNRRAWSYGLRLIGISIIASIPLIIIVVVTLSGIPTDQPASIVATGLAALVAVIVSLRLSVALPAVAVDKPGVGLGDAWKATKNNSIRLLIISVVTAIPFLLVEGVTALMVQNFPPTGGFVILHLVLFEPLSLATELLLVLVGVTLLSLAYAFLIENREAGTTMPAS